MATSPPEGTYLYERKNILPNGMVTIYRQTWTGTAYHVETIVRLATPEEVEEAGMPPDFAAPAAESSVVIEEMEEKVEVVADDPLIVGENSGDRRVVSRGSALGVPGLGMRSPPPGFEHVTPIPVSAAELERLLSTPSDSEDEREDKGKGRRYGKQRARKRRRVTLGQEEAPGVVETATPAESMSPPRAETGSDDTEFVVSWQEYVVLDEEAEKEPAGVEPVGSSGEPVPSTSGVASGAAYSGDFCLHVDVSNDDFSDESDGDSVVTVVPRQVPSPACAPSTSTGNTIRYRHCPVCREPSTDSRLRRHIEIAHLPFWIAPERACWECRVQESSVAKLQKAHQQTCPPAAMTEATAVTWVHLCNGLLHLLSQALECDSNAEMLDLVCSRGYYPQSTAPFHLSMSQRLLYRTWEEINELPLTPLEQFGVSPPVAVACLLHPKVLACILCHLPKAIVKRAANYGETTTPYDVEELERVQRSVDAHIHVDKLPVPYQNSLGSEDDTHVGYQFLVANFVFPKRWSRWQQLREDPSLYSTFGIHPNLCGAGTHIVQKHQVELRTLLTSARCVAIGEIGLDYDRCRSASQKESQRECLDLMLRLRPPTLPIVVHCRGSGALADCLEIMTARVRSKTVAVQLHCFLGDRRDVSQLMAAFPGCMFSIGPKSMELSGDENREHQLAVRGLRLEQILLETDAPYVRTNHASPRAALMEIARWVGQQKGLCASIVLEAARVNACRVFSVPEV